MKALLIRHAGGVYWIIRRDQSGEYCPPLTVNESAAEILKLLQEGTEEEAIAELLAEGDHELIPEICSDIRALKQETEQKLRVKLDGLQKQS